MDANNRPNRGRVTITKPVGVDKTDTPVALQPGDKVRIDYQALAGGAHTETNVTYRALAHKTGLSAGYLNHLVHGNRPVPSDDVIAELADALGVAPEHFREVRVRRISEKLEQMPELIDRLYRRLS